MKAIWLGICVFFSALGALAQTTVTTTGGSTNSIAKFSGSSTIVNAGITENGGNVFVGPVTPTLAQGTVGYLGVSGTYSALGMVRQTLTSWPGTPAAGDAFLWYNPDGTARLWTNQTGDLLKVSNQGNGFMGPVTPSLASGTVGFFSVSGTSSALGFVRQTLTSWPGTPAAGDAMLWYNPDGTARLWTNQTGDLLIVKNNGEVDLKGALRFSDGTTQTTAQVQGPQGPAGPQGPQGPQGPPGPQITTTFSAHCAGTLNPGDSIVLNPLGQTGSQYCSNFYRGITVLYQGEFGEAQTGNFSIYTDAPSNTKVDTQYGFAVPRAGTLSNLRVSAITAGSSSTTGRILVRKITTDNTVDNNSADVLITCTLGTATSCSDTTHTLSIAAGERILVTAYTASGSSETLTSLSVLLDLN